MIDNAFVEFMVYIFGDWANWFRFTLTMLILKETILKMAISGTSVFWSWATSIFNKNKN